MNRQELFNQIKNKRSFLCVGLDPDLDKMPKSLNGDLFAFNKAIIDATAQYAVAFKPNLAFYEVQGVKGLQAFEDTVKYIRERYPEIMIIADAKRGDIGNTSKMYAKSFFETMNVDALTVAPYMGEDSVTPFLTYEGKWVVVLALTSNKGSLDFQHIKDEEGTPLFKRVLATTRKWGNADNMMYVCGATQAEMFTQIREIAPDNFLLGAAAQLGVFTTFLGALALGAIVPGINFGVKEASSIGIIGGADGPTAIYTTSKLYPNLLGPIAVAAYSYIVA